MFNKKGDGGLTAIVIILIVLIFLGWLVNIGRRECNSNKECGNDYYCGSDFKCHQYPNIQKTITQVDYTRPALIIGIAIIIAALIFKYFNVKKKEEVAETIKPKEEKIKPKTETIETKKEDVKGEVIYQNYPDYTQYTIKTEDKRAYPKGKFKKDKNFFSNNYVGLVLAGLIAVGIILATNLDYIGVAVFGAVILFWVVYKLWSYCIEYNAEIYLIALLSLIYITLALIYFSKSGIIFPLIGMGFLVITLFVVKETVSWLGYKIV